MIRRTLALLTLGSTLAACTPDVAGLLNAAKQAAQQQTGNPATSASPAPGASASPAPTASVSPAAGATSGAQAAVTATVTLDGQPGTIKPVAAAKFTPVGAYHTAQYTIGEKAQDGSLMLVVTITSKKAFTAADLGKADLMAFSVQVVRLGGAGILSTQRILNMLQIPKEDITVTPNGGKLDIKANLTSFIGVGTIGAAQIDLKGLPTT